MIEERIRLVNVYYMMLERCYNPKNHSFDGYGGRGIYVDNRWLLDPTAFINWSLQNGSAKGLHLDRVDNDGPYSPDNCRYVTPAENMRNRRTTVNVTAFGETKCVIDWLGDERCVVGNFVLYQRINLGWNPEIALTTPANDFSTRKLTAFNETKEWTDWAVDPRCLVSAKTLVARINRGWDHEAAITTPPDASRKGKTPHNAKLIEAFGESKTIAEWVSDDRCTYKSKRGVMDRIYQNGWTPERAMTEPVKKGRPRKVV